MTAATDGPSLEQYVETRLNLLTESIKDKALAQDAALMAAAEAARAAALAIKAASEAAAIATDLRYQQRFEAQSDALAAAFLSQQTAMQTAFVVAEKAVGAALAAADRAVSKAELASDKRFEALNELRQMLNDTLKNLMTRTEVDQMIRAVSEKVSGNAGRIETIDGRLNTIAGETSGGRRTKDDGKALLAIGISVVGALIGIAVFLMKIFGH